MRQYLTALTPQLMRFVTNRQFFLLAAVLSLLAGLALGPGIGLLRPVKADTFTVCPVGCSSTTISGAIALAANGDTITVAAGTYNEQIIVDKSVAINGPNIGINPCTGTRVAEAIVNGSDSAFQIHANSVSINGFTIQGVTGAFGAGIWTQTGISGTEIFNNIIQNNVMGIYLNGSNALVQFNKIENNNNPGSSAGNGIYSDNGLSTATIDSNCFTGHTNDPIILLGPAFSGGSGVVSNINVTNNSVINDSTILFGDASTITVTGNTVVNSLFSAVQFAGAVNGATVTGNTLLNNQGAGVRVTNDVAIPNLNISATCNRIVGNQGGAAGININAGAYTGTLAAENNWFGCNAGPGNPGCDAVIGTADFSPWLVLTLSGPDAIFDGGASVLTASLTTNSTPGPAPCTVPDGTPVAFATTCGIVDPASTTTAAGTANSNLTAGPTPGACSYSTTVDNQTITNPLTINPRPLVTVVDTFECTGPGDALDVTVSVNNTTGAIQPFGFSVTFPAGLVGVGGSCVANVGVCNIDGLGVTYSANLPPGPSTITYKVQVGDAVPPDTVLCFDTAFSFDGGTTLTTQSCVTVNCSTGGVPGLVIPTESSISDQKPGSVLVYNLVTSNPSVPHLQNTQISITNVNPALPTAVHLFFVDGSTCSVADSFVCLTPHQTLTFLASEQDPGTTGYLVAVAVDPITGCPISFNSLIGDEFVKMSSGHAANLMAETFAAIAGGLPLCDANATTAQLNFDGISYNQAARVLASSGLPSRVEGNSTLLVVNRIGGSLQVGAAGIGSLFGILYNDQEEPHSFTIPTPACQLAVVLSNDVPRTTPRYEDVIPGDSTGWMKFWGGTDIGILGATINFNGNVANSADAYNQGHNLHKLKLTSTSFTMPIFPPHCL